MALDVLIVDDSAAIRKILQRVLRQADLPLGQMHEAGDGVEALAKLKIHRVNLILVDINMPNMDGLQFLSQVKASPELRNVPVVMVTTEGTKSKVIEAVQLGAAGFVHKPFTAHQINDTVTKILS